MPDPLSQSRAAQGAPDPTPASCTIRPARMADCAGLADLINPMIRDTTITFTTAPKDALTIGALLAGGQTHWIAEHEGALLGYATYFPFRGGPGYAHTKEHSILLAPQARGRGVGRALMAVMLDHARAEGVHSMMAGVSGENPAGRAFHAALGFAHVARLPQVGFKFGRWLDLDLMQKML